MLELPFLRAQREEAEERLAKRHIEAKALVGRALELDEQRRSVQGDLDARQAELNALSRTIGDLMKAGNKEEAEQAKVRTVAIKTAIQELGDRMETAEKALHDHLCTIPNAPARPGRRPRASSVAAG